MDYTALGKKLCFNLLVWILMLEPFSRRKRYRQSMPSVVGAYKYTTFEYVLWIWLLDTAPKFCRGLPTIPCAMSSPTWAESFLSCVVQHQFHSVALKQTSLYRSLSEAVRGLFELPEKEELMSGLLHPVGCVDTANKVRCHVEPQELHELPPFTNEERGVFHPRGSPEVHNDLFDLKDQTKQTYCMWNTVCLFYFGVEFFFCVWAVMSGS